MSISPPSDIVLDVARAADPARYSQAAAKLTSTPPSTDAFDQFLRDVPGSGSTTAADASKLAAIGATKVPAKAAEAYQSFEAMTLATMIEASLPSDADDVFGAGTAGSVWKSMLAEQLGTQMAKAGGIGIATQLARSAQAAFTADTAGAADAGGQAKSLLLDTIQRGFVRGLSPADDDTTVSDTAPLL